MDEPESVKTFETSLLTTPVGEWVTKQAIIFDWYDGPREGVCSLASPKVDFYFKLIDERNSPDDLNDRLFALSQIQGDAVEQIVSTLRDLGPAATPMWVPVWQFPNESAKEAAENTIDRVIEKQRETEIVIHTRNMIDFLGCWRVPRGLQVSDWFSYLGV